MTISSNLKTVNLRIQHAERQSHRPIKSVDLLAVSKQHRPEAIIEAFEAGQRDFGENYVQEALIKMRALSNFPICWHFIGRIQHNKAKIIARHFAWVHAVSSVTIAESLNAARPSNMPALNVCIQLNIDDEDSKAGVNCVEAVSLAAHILTLPRLSLRGLMVIPKPKENIEAQAASFLKVNQCLQQINQQLNIAMDTLSMGMSDDFETAIHAGSTMVRLGTAIFGERDDHG